MLTLSQKFTHTTHKLMLKSSRKSLYQILQAMKGMLHEIKCKRDFHYNISHSTEYIISQVSYLIMSITKRVLHTNDNVLKKCVL